MYCAYFKVGKINFISGDVKERHHDGTITEPDSPYRGINWNWNKKIGQVCGETARKPGVRFENCLKFLQHIIYI